MKDSSKSTARPELHIGKLRMNESRTRTQKNFKIGFFLGIAAILLYAIFPIICMAITIALTSIFGCAMGEDTYHQCIVVGIDFGPIIAFGSVGPFLLFITLPSGVVAVGLYTTLMLLINRKVKFI